MAVPFYQKTDGDTALNADLLFGIGETVGCGERNVSGCDVLDAIKDHNVNESEYEWYIKMHERYPLQTSGFGMGGLRGFYYLF